MRRYAAVLLGLILTLSATFVWLFGSGAVFGQEAGSWPTISAVVRTRVLGDDLVRLSSKPEKYVATPAAGAHEYVRLMGTRGLTLVDQAGGAMLFRHRTGRRCTGAVFQFTSDLVVYYPPDCDSDSPSP